MREGLGWAGWSAAREVKKTIIDQSRLADTHPFTHATPARLSRVCTLVHQTSQSGIAYVLGPILQPTTHTRVRVPSPRFAISCQTAYGISSATICIAYWPMCQGVLHYGCVSKHARHSPNTHSTTSASSPVAVRLCRSPMRPCPSSTSIAYRNTDTMGLSRPSSE
jgi:hypothetical protein